MDGAAVDVYVVFDVDDDECGTKAAASVKVVQLAAATATIVAESFMILL